MKARTLARIWSSVNDALAMPACRMPAFSTRNSTWPPFAALTAPATSMVTEPSFGFGIRPRGPSTLPSLPTTAIMSGVAMQRSNSILPPVMISARSSAPTRSAPAFFASSAFGPLAKTATRTVLPVPDGIVTTPRTIWSAWRGSTPRFIAISMVSSNFALALLLTSLIASSRVYGHHQERHHGNRDGRAFAQHAAVDAALEGQRGHQMGGVIGAAAGDRVDQLEVGEGEENREGQHDAEDRQQVRHGHIPEPLPGIGAVQRGGFVEAGRDGLQAGEQADRHEGDAAPDVGGDHRGTGIVLVAEKIDIGVDQPHLGEHPGDDRKLGVVDPPEGNGRQHRRHDIGQQHHSPDDRLHRQVAV